MKTVFCMAEDRHGAEIGIQLAVLSVVEHCPDAKLFIFRPRSAPGFAEWVATQPGCQLIETTLPGANNWNCKPQALLETLSRTGQGSQVVWLDSDLVVTADLATLLAKESPETLAITQEPLSATHQGSEIRTRGWGLAVGRAFRESFNSCVVRTTHHHIPLLEHWQSLLADPGYLQRAPEKLEQKPPHLWSDQDVLQALLGSALYQQVPIRVLRHGIDILHTGGGLAFSMGERLRGLSRPLPTVLHAIGVKPWVLLGRGSHEPGWFPWFRRLMQETSQYVVYVRRYRGPLHDPLPWTTASTPLGRLLNLLSCGHWALRGLPVTLACRFIRLVRPM